MKLIITMSLMSCVLMFGCRGSCSPVISPAGSASLISHIVFVELQDENQLIGFRRSADRMLSTIPSVATYAAGSHLDTGRSTVLNDYDLVIYLGFASEEDLATYVAHEQHIDFVEQWKPKIKSLRVYDMLDEPNSVHQRQ